jgi:hypothetical protein
MRSLAAAFALGYVAVASAFMSSAYTNLPAHLACTTCARGWPRRHARVCAARIPAPPQRLSGRSRGRGRGERAAARGSRTALVLLRTARLASSEAVRQAGTLPWLHNCAGPP